MGQFLLQNFQFSQLNRINDQISGFGDSKMGWQVKNLKPRQSLLKSKKCQSI